MADSNLSSLSVQYLINEDGAEFWYVRNWYPKPEELYNYLLNNIPWEQHEGKSHGGYLVPRLMYHMGDDNIKQYSSYGGQSYPLHDWDPFLLEIRDILAKHFYCHLDTGLLNYYPDGKSYIAMHPDRESLGADNITIGISLGASRDFVLKRNSDGHRIVFETRAGDLYVMRGNIHKNWTHGLPKRLRVKDGRISITYRQILPSPHYV